MRRKFRDVGDLDKEELLTFINRRLTSIIVFSGISVATIVIGVGIFINNSYDNDRDLTRVFQQFIDTRDEARITACKLDRASALAFNAGLQEDINTLVTLHLDNRVEAVQAQKVKVRLCDDASIEMWYATNGVEGLEDPTDRTGN